jgi:hypothetical protein
MKAAARFNFGFARKYERFPNLLFAFVWDLDDPARTSAVCMTLPEVVEICEQLGWTTTGSWEGTTASARRGGAGYSTLAPGWDIDRNLQVVAEAFGRRVDSLEVGLAQLTCRAEACAAGSVVANDVSGGHRPSADYGPRNDESEVANRRGCLRWDSGGDRCRLRPRS